MKFDQTLQRVAESLYELETEVNQDFQKWKAANPNLAATGSAYLHFKKGRTDSTYTGGQRGRPSKSAAAADLTPAVPPAMTPEPGARYKELPDTLATKNKVEEMLNADPEVGLEEVMARVKADAANGEETLNTEDEVIINAYNAATQSRAGASTAEEPTLDPNMQKRLDRHAAIRAGMARRGMKPADPEALAKRLGKKIALRKTSDQPGTEEPEIPLGDIEDMKTALGRGGSRATDFED